MKKITAICLAVLLIISFAGCGSNKESYLFKSMGLDVRMSPDTSMKIACDDKGIYVADIQNGSSLGVISVDKNEGKTLSEIYDTYLLGGNAKVTKNEISKKLIFADVLSETESQYVGTVVDKMYCFVFYDEKTGAVLYGRFFENCDRELVLNLAKSIEVKNI